ncbi:MAG: ATP-grasp domain-containing protein [Planctomycetota bacterium]|nr:MAG: ATP-grasp domain-containing protein [Planctomycetota bacterium]
METANKADGPRKNIFVVGRDEFNFAKLHSLAAADRYEIHGLLDLSEIRSAEPCPLDHLLRRAEAQLDEFPGSIDAIVGYWDFPITDLVPVLSQRRNLPSASLESVLKCEHKYWSRIESRKVIPEMVPKFRSVDPFDDAQVDNISLDYPYWLKPIKSFASYLGFRIKNRRDLEAVVPQIRNNIGRLGNEFNDALQRVDLPQEVDGVDGLHCIAEEIITGRQCTVEGYVYSGEVRVYGVVDSFRESNRSTFSRYQYPSQLPKNVRSRMIDAAERVMSHIGYDMAPFNVEFFYNADNGKIWLLEINPRISQSHCDLFEKVDGASNHKVMIQLALGEEPTPPTREGKFKCAAKFFMRHYGDALVTQTPSENDIQRVQAEIPDALIKIGVKEQTRLSELQHQDSYSFELANVYIGAQNQRDLLKKKERAFELLPFEFTDEERRRAS